MALAQTLDDLPLRTALAQAARDFHRRGWMAGTAGNLSARSRPDRFWITASGKPKGGLDESDFLEIAIADGEVVDRPTPDLRPSAETSIHQAIYQIAPDAGACLHVHTVDASLATAGATGDELALPALEMIKGLGVWEQDPRVGLALFDNWLDVPRIAAAIRERFGAKAPRLPALMIRSHGVTVWGKSIQQAYDRLECLEFLMQYVARQAT